MKRILVLGDWVVDQHWVTGIHRSPMSSRTGEAHYRSLQAPDGTTESLCAAGQVATVLRRAEEESGKHLFEVVGLGLWHEEDTDALAAMLNPSSLKGQTPHRIVRKKPEKPDNVTLINLGGALQVPYGTTKVIRIYQHTGARIDLIQRIDWEQRPPSGQSEWIEDAGVLSGVRVGSGVKVKSRPWGRVRGKGRFRGKGWSRISGDEGKSLACYLQENPVDAIVIKDNHKGVVSEALVRWLVNFVQENLGPVPWFVSTKVWNAAWLSALEGVDIRLLLVPQIAARQAVLQGQLNTWITGSGHASKKALALIDGMARRLDSAPAIVVLPSGLSILARDYRENGNQKKGILQAIDTPTSLAVGVPMASVFFPTLISLMLTRQDDSDFGKLLDKSLEFTEKWRAHEVKLIEDPERWEPDKKPVFRVGREFTGTGDWNSFDWESAKKNWEDAFSGYGIITEENKKRIELWRSMTEISDYICCVKSKRTVLQRLLQEFSPVRYGKAKRSRSCILIASPGSGKTFLVRCLAKSLRLRFLPFNITQMLLKRDILDCFDKIVTTQAQNPEETLLVFFDEINAKLEGQPVYDVFLAPLEEGVYVRAEKTFHIDPCVWIFAGTERPKADGERFTKGSDFEDRLTIREPLSLRIEEPTSDEARVEKVYLGVSLLRSVFPDVRMVSEKALRTLRQLPGDLEVRRVRHIVQSCTNIQYGEVWARNFDTALLEDLGIDTMTWKEQPEGELVEIVSRSS